MKIYKYLLEVTDEQVLELPKNAGILSVAEQNGNIVLYAMVNPEMHTEKIRIAIIGTGHEIPRPQDLDRFVGTVKQRGGLLMWHVFVMR